LKHFQLSNDRWLTREVAITILFSILSDYKRLLNKVYKRLWADFKLLYQQHLKNRHLL